MTNQEHIQALIDNITTDLRKLRTLIEEPVGIQFAEGVQIQVQPKGDSTVITKSGLGSVVVSFDDEAVEVFVVDMNGNYVDPVTEPNHA